MYKSFGKIGLIILVKEKLNKFKTFKKIINNKTYSYKNYQNMKI